MKTTVKSGIPTWCKDLLEQEI